jgi:hypothetical protein
VLRARDRNRPHAAFAVVFERYDDAPTLDVDHASDHPPAVSTAPYRTAALPAASPARLVLSATDDHPTTGWFPHVLMRVVVGFVAAVDLATLEPSLAILAAVAGLAWAVGAWRGRRALHAIFTVCDRSITIERHNEKTWRIALDELDDVRLETAAAVLTPALESDEHGVRGTTTGDGDDSHLELVSGGQVLTLTTARMRPAIASERLHDLRRFLRAHGWTPRDERPRLATAPARS